MNTSGITYRQHVDEIEKSFASGGPLRFLFGTEDAYVAALLGALGDRYLVSSVLDGVSHVRDLLGSSRASLTAISLHEFLRRRLDEQPGAGDERPHLLWIRSSELFEAASERPAPPETLMLRELVERWSNTSHRILVTGRRIQVHPHLVGQWKVIEPSLPRDGALKTYVKELVRKYGCDEQEQELIATDLRGQGATVIARILQDVFGRPDCPTSRDTRQQLWREERDRYLKRSNILELISDTRGVETVAGLEGYKEWLDDKRALLTNHEEAQRKGISLPRGVLLAGVPGCGKSLMAKVTAFEFDRPLLRLDVGRVMAKYVGESEARLREALQTAEASAPCVLWIDEIEKALKGAGGSGGGKGGDGSEVTSRLVGELLTWMQERKEDVLLVATANAVDTLPPELLRRGRFDEFFFFDLPSADERRALLVQEVGRSEDGTRRPWCIAGEDEGGLDRLVKLTQGYSSADLKQLVSLSIEHEFLFGKRGTELNGDKMVVQEETFLLSAKRITPYGKGERRTADLGRMRKTFVEELGFWKASSSDGRPRELPGVESLDPKLQAVLRPGELTFELKLQGRDRQGSDGQSDELSVHLVLMRNKRWAVLRFSGFKEARFRVELNESDPTRVRLRKLADGTGRNLGDFELVATERTLNLVDAAHPSSQLPLYGSKVARMWPLPKAAGENSFLYCYGDTCLYAAVDLAGERWNFLPLERTKAGSLVVPKDLKFAWPKSVAGLIIQNDKPYIRV